MEGARVVVLAKPSFWEANGSLSLEIREIRPQGEGELLAQLEARRRALAAEGLFDARLKRPLPFLPRGVGLVTGKASDAERDVLENARKRWPSVHFVVHYAFMQGTQSAASVIEAVRLLDANDEVDVIVIARGGGSLHDLLPFSDEALIRAVAACTTPVISAIGHEPDTPILDHVADHRASTPTDAAKTVVPAVADELAGVAQARARAAHAVRRLLEHETAALTALRSRPVLAQPHVLVDAQREVVRDALSRTRQALRHLCRPRARRREPPPGAGPGALPVGHDATRLRRGSDARGSRPDIRRRRARRIHGATGRRPRRRPQGFDPGAHMTEELSYEAARDELIAIVAKLEAGGLGLEESLKLWERGEAVAAICQERLEGVRKRLQAAAQDSAATDNDET